MKPFAPVTHTTSSLFSLAISVSASTSSQSMRWSHCPYPKNTKISTVPLKIYYIVSISPNSNDKMPRLLLDA